VANWRPDLFRGILAEVPWTDVVTDSLDPTLPLVTVEYEGVGRPETARTTTNICARTRRTTTSRLKPTRRCYVTGAFNDTQVAYWNPAKWVAKLRLMKRPIRTRSCSSPTWPRATAGASGRLERVPGSRR